MSVSAIAVLSGIILLRFSFTATANDNDGNRRINFLMHKVAKMVLILTSGRSGAQAACLLSITAARMRCNGFSRAAAMRPFAKLL